MHKNVEMLHFEHIILCINAHRISGRTRKEKRGKNVHKNVFLYEKLYVYVCMFEF